MTINICKMENAEAVRPKEALILAIESSCDETAAAVVRDGREVLSNIVSTQIAVHELYGGVVPEIASRRHIEAVDIVVEEALRQANLKLNNIDAIAVTYGPGLVGALLVGVSCAKALAYASGKPLIAVNHIEGHICANYISAPTLKPPFLCLVASGGHTYVVHVPDFCKYHLLGQTLDDAAGEAFDKAARVLGLPYPGGARLDKLASAGNPNAYLFPRPKLEGKYDFSFSGLKTALINKVHQLQQSGKEFVPADIAASFQYAVVEQLTSKTTAALRDCGATVLAVAGGVAANTALRNSLKKGAGEMGIDFFVPSKDLCTDNAAMIGSAAYWRWLKGEFADLSLNAYPSLCLPMD